ncbi:MAG: glycosyltransferase family 2 protein [Parvularculaceae bacterium]
MQQPMSAPAALFEWRSPAPSDGAPALSIIAPMHNEEKGAAALVREIAAAVAGLDAEIIIVDDGSTDGTRSALVEEKKSIARLRVLAHEIRAGQSRAIRTGVLAARAPVAATLDGDGQNDPADIPALYRQLIREDAPKELAMVAGERRSRRDPPSRRLGSRVANAVRAQLLEDGAIDAGCGIKAFYREAFLRLPAFDHMHRYLPALMRREGFLVEFAAVAGRPRTHGRSKYTNLGRLFVAFRDVLGVMWLKDRARTPREISEL